MPGARFFSSLLVLAAAMGGAALLADQELGQQLARRAAQTLEVLRIGLLDRFLLNPYFHAMVASILALELLIPVDEDRPLLNKGLLVDALWLPLTIVFALATPLYVMVSQHIFFTYLGFLRIESLMALPFWARFLLALLVGDFINYLGHVLRHKVPTFWYFHAVHHAQRELNLFTENRAHPFDLFFHHLISFVPMLMIEPSPTSLVTILWLRHWHLRFCHAGIKTNLGPLRYLLVTPQSHRVHHSLDPAHQDKNFGVTFSLWDHLFGTQLRDYEVYPECGIDDDDFPFEQDGRGVLAAIAAQLVYPFKKLAKPESTGNSTPQEVS